MTAIRRISTINVMKMNTRNFVTRTRTNRGGAHDDHHHHEHKLWENLPFKKGPTAALVFGGAAAGAGLIVFATWFQNWKHGFLNKKE
mmetsp:Transcript_10316/g.11146  ORF Transcript_10316/g.11146 Transcript_10316/m.11146 type:complete len:87 (+) Transcript_10316:61-321(+)